MKRTLTALLFTLPSVLSAQATTLGVDSIFSAFAGTDRPGCAVGVVQGGRPVFAKGYGMADLAQGIAITPQSVFHVASVSKQFTGMSLVLLARAGRLSLDDDVRKYLTDVPTYEKPITIRHLLTHTGGVRDQWSLLMTAGWRLGDDLITEQDVRDIVTAQKGLNFAPGSDWLYSNSGFTMAAMIVQRVTGRTLRAFADSAIFRPLGMSQTHFHDDNLMVVPRRTRGFTLRSGEWKETVPNYSTVGATSLFTTVVDLARWHVQLDSGIVGGRAALDDLVRRAVLTTGDTLGYALGVAVGTYRGALTVSHSGGDPGYSSYLLHFPKTQSGVSVLCNSSGVANPTALAEQTADVILASELGPRPTLAAQVTAAQLGGAAGLYWSEGAEAVGRLVVDSGLAVWRGGTGLTGGARLRVSGTNQKWLLGAGPASLSRQSDASVLFRSANGEPATYVKVAPWAPNAVDRTALAGRYYSSEVDVTWEIRVSGDSAMLHRRKFAPALLTAVFRDTYTATGAQPYLIRAIRGDGGRVMGITAGSGRVRRLRFDRIVERR